MNHQLFTFFSLLALTLPAFAEKPIVVFYNERPPFVMKKNDGNLEGYAASPAMSAFASAAIPFEVREASPNRRLAAIKENTEPFCSIGLYKSSEREAFALFSKPVSRDSKMIGLANPQFRFKEPVSIDTLLSRPDVQVLVRQGISYGSFLNAKFNKMKAKKIESAAEYSKLVRLIKIGRAQLMFLPEEEALFYLQEAGYTPADLKLIKFPEMPAGELRYIMCSLKVGETFMQRLNQGIHFTE